MSYTELKIKSSESPPLPPAKDTHKCKYIHESSDPQGCLGSKAIPDGWCFSYNLVE